MTRQHPATVRATLDAIVRGLAPLRATPPQRLSDWARASFYLSAEASQTQGQWIPYPFQVGIMDAMSNDDIEELTVRKAKRVGYTKMLCAFVAYNAAHRRRKQAVWQPTDDDRDSFVKSEIDPMLRDVKALEPVLIRGKKEDTLKMKVFLGSVLHTLGGKAARAYRRITVSAAILDEADGFDWQVEKSSDPVTLARGRLEGAAFPKLIVGSTPRRKGLSHIESRETAADARMRYHIACPHCQAPHPLEWGGKEWAHGFKGGGMGGDDGPVRHVCPHCHGSITQGQYLEAAESGEWVSDCGSCRYGPDRQWRDERGEPCRPPRHIAMHIWSAYSPQRTWADIVREFREAQREAKAGNFGPLEGFVNETLGELWEPKGESADEHALQARAEDYPLCEVPAGGLVLTAGVDVQGNRWEIGVWAWGRGMESWVVDHQVIEGNPADPGAWETVETYLQRRYTQAWHGGSLAIEAISIDSGHHTQAVYDFVRRAARWHRHCYAIKGDSVAGNPLKGRGIPQDIDYRGQKLRGGVKVWYVGVDTAKDLLHGQLSIRQAGPGYVHLCKHLPREWFEQFTAEQRIPVRTPTGSVERWVKKRPRNEVLDCRNYATHAAHMLGLPGASDAEWLRIEMAVQPPTEVLIPVAQARPPQPMPAAAARLSPSHASAAHKARASFGRQW